MTHTDKHLSKSGQPWRHDPTETAEQRRARRHATKAAARRRRRKLAYMDPGDTPELRAARAQRAKAAALKLFKKWLETRAVTEFAARRESYCDLVHWVREALPDVLPEY